VRDEQTQQLEQRWFNEQAFEQREEEEEARIKTWPAWAKALALSLIILTFFAPMMLFDSSFEVVIAESIIGLLIFYFSSKPPLLNRITAKAVEIIVDDIVQDTGSRIDPRLDGRENDPAVRTYRPHGSKTSGGTE
jgi:hypothetical protein